MYDNNNQKGIILAGGTGTRLYPITKVISKQLIPIYDKPMIYYPLSTLMLADIRDILIITTPNDKDLFEQLLGDGSWLGISIKYSVQKNPDGLAQAISIGSKFINQSNVALILGDNLFYGQNLISKLQGINSQNKGCTVFAYPVNDPERYGVIDFDKNGKVLSIEEKPKFPKSIYALTGLYFFDSDVVNLFKKLKPSARGELEITDLVKLYLARGDLRVEIMSRGMTWLDTGTCDSLNEASEYIRIIEKRQGLKICCPEEIAWRKGWINDKQLENLAKPLIKSGYGNYILKILKEKK